MHIRLANESDASAIRAIYAPLVEETTISFEHAPPSEEEIAQRVRTTLATHPWLVAEIDGDIAGYAYAGTHRSRTAYQWATEVSVYVNTHYRRRGVAKKLYTALLEALRFLGYVNAYAGIAQPNEASVALHEAFGFEPVGVYRRVGFKHDEWHDVGWWQLRLREDDAPEPPRRLAEVVESEEWEAVLAG